MHGLLATCIHLAKLQKVDGKALVILFCKDQCCDSMTFWYGSVSGDTCLSVMDLDPAIFVIDLQDADKKLI